MMIRRRFVNIVVENYRSGMYSLHRLDVSKHLFYPSTAEAQVLSAGPEALANIGGRGDAPPVTDRLPELPAPCMSFNPSPTNNWNNPRLAFFGLVSPRCSEGKVLSFDGAGHALLYDADSHSTIPMPTLGHPKGISPVVVSVPRPGAKEEDLYIMHTAPAAAGLDSEYSFDVLRFGTPGQLRVVRTSSPFQGWYWQSLPLPPFVYSPQYKPSLISSYTVVDGGRGICLSSATEAIGTYCFDTVSGEWSHAGNWVLPFDGRVEYSPELKLWLGFSLDSHHHLCAMSGLSAMVNQPPVLHQVWQDQMPKEWMATRVSIVNLGAGRFCIAKVFKVAPNTSAEEKAGYFSDWGVADDDEFVVLTGLEIHCSHDDNNLLQWLQSFKHKSIRYMCTSNSIHCVL